MTVILSPESLRLHHWRAIYFGASAALDPACRTRGRGRRRRPSRRSSHKGEPVYGINTGFGKLASVRIEAADLEQLQRNIVLSHAAGVGEPLPDAVVAARHGAEDREPRAGRVRHPLGTRSTARRLLALDVLPVIPAQGSVGASGDLAPLAHLTPPSDRRRRGARRGRDG